MVLVTFQLIMLLLFAIMAIVKREASGGWRGIQLVVVQPRRAHPVGLHHRAVRVDLRLLGLGHRPDRQRGVQEPRHESRPGGAAVRAVDPAAPTCWSPVATQMFAGMGDTGLGLANEEVSDNVFGNLAEPILGNPLTSALYLAVLASSAASLITTFLPTIAYLAGDGRLRGDTRSGSRTSTPVQDPEHGHIRGRNRRRRLLHRS